MKLSRLFFSFSIIQCTTKGREWTDASARRCERETLTLEDGRRNRGGGVQKVGDHGEASAPLKSSLLELLQKKENAQ